MAQEKKKGPKGTDKKASTGFTGGEGQDRKDPDKALEKINKVQYGANSVDLDLDGFTIQEIQEALADSLNLNNAAEAYIDGQKVADKNNVKLQTGQKLEFMKEAGVKG